MKIALIRLAIVSALLVTIVGCSSTTVIPQTSGIFTVITTASSEQEAFNMAMTRATNICGQYSAEPKVIDQEIKYQGIDKNQQRLAKFARSLLPSSKASGPYTPPDHEYKATVAIKCE